MRERETERERRRECDWFVLPGSAKTRDGVQEAFQELVQKVLQTPSLYSTEQQRDILDPLAPPTNEASWCGGSCTVT